MGNILFGHREKHIAPEAKGAALIHLLRLVTQENSSEIDEGSHDLVMAKMTCNRGRGVTHSISHIVVFAGAMARRFKRQRIKKLQIYAFGTLFCLFETNSAPVFADEPFVKSPHIPPMASSADDIQSGHSSFSAASASPDFTTTLKMVPTILKIAPK